MPGKILAAIGFPPLRKLRVRDFRKGALEESERG
jgi:hypothetical protein